MSNQKTITLTRLFHREKGNIAIGYEYNKKTKALVKAINGINWSSTHSTFYIEHRPNMVHELFEYFKGHGYYIDYSALKPKKQNVYTPTKKIKHKSSMDEMFKNLSKNNTRLLKTYIGFLKGKRLSPSTIKSYGYFVLRFLDFQKPTTIETLKNSDLSVFFEKVLAYENFSISSHRQCVSALKYFIAYFDLPDLDAEDLIRPKKSKKLPVVLSKEEVIDLIRVTKNLKHRAIIGLLYSCGLRIGELLHLKINDLDFDRNILRVNKGKGRKDRNVTMSKMLSPLVFNYLNTYRPKNYIFEGRNGSTYSAESVRHFLKKNCKEACISKNVTPHVLRHSYATHMLENGVDLRHIQMLLGHAKPETTMIYTHVAQNDLMQISNPLDMVIKSISNSSKDSHKVLLSRNYVL